MHRLYAADYGGLECNAIVIKAPTLPDARVFAGLLVLDLRARRVPLARVDYRLDPKHFEGRGLLYLSREKLEAIRDKILDYQDFVEAFAGRPTLDQLVDGVATQVANAFVTAFIDLGLHDAKSSLDIRFAEDLVAQIATRLDRPPP